MKLDPTQAITGKNLLSSWTASKSLLPPHPPPAEYSAPLNGSLRLWSIWTLVQMTNQSSSRQKHRALIQRTMQVLDETKGKAVEVTCPTTAEDSGWMTGATSVDSLDEMPTTHEDLSEASSHKQLPSTYLGTLLGWSATFSPIHSATGLP